MLHNPPPTAYAPARRTVPWKGTVHRCCLLLALAAAGQVHASPDWGAIPESCWLRRPYALRYTYGRTGDHHYSNISLIRGRPRVASDSAFQGKIIPLATVVDDVQRVAVTERYIVAELSTSGTSSGEKSPAKGAYAVVDVADQNAKAVYLKNDEDFAAFARDHPELMRPSRFQTFEEVHRESIPWLRRSFLIVYVVCVALAIAAAVLARWVSVRSVLSTSEASSAGPRPPWEQEGARRWDSRPHRGALLLGLGTASLIFGSLSLCLCPCNLVSLPLGLITWGLARHDLGQMRVGLIDRQGRDATMRALRDAVCGVVLSLPALLFWLYGCWNILE
jgi:hypothetical protein